MNEESSKSSVSESRLWEIAWAFLRLGFVAFGGAAAHIAMMEQEFVQRRKWLTREDFLDRVGAVSLLPGPSSTELAIYLGELRGGLAGLLIAGCSFILPSAFLVGVLAWIYQRYGSAPQLGAILFGVKPIVVALIVQAVWSLARVAVKSIELAFLAGVVLALAAVHVSAIALLIGTGVAWIVAERFGGKSGATKTARGVLAQGGVAAAASTFSAPTVTGVFLYFLKVGAVLFGSGYVLLAVLRADLVERLHWLTENQLIDAIAVSQGTPGPFFTVSTFIGYVMAGWKGAVLATVGMFLPAFVFVAVTAKFLPRLRKSPMAGAFLDGVNAAAVALMGFVGWQFARETLVSLPAIAIGIVAAVLLLRFKVNSAWLVLGGAVAGIALRLVHVG
ncbi:MAG TPA: chromate efflux transporter [Candidatus Dormibacteraeota bacterium]|jgi:chromate transporter|nr:chromate efflux transporter [Candidatus Dormibacteraeota bacterium]